MVKSNKQKKQEIKKKRLQKNAKQTPSFANKNGQLSLRPDYLANFDDTQKIDFSTLSLGMQQIIANAYNLFGCYPAPTHFSVCTICCMSIEEEQALRTLPLALLPRELIYSYNNSAKAELNGKDEVAYVLPRILELIAFQENIHHSVELYLCWLAKVPFEKWSIQEQDLLQQFALQYIEDIFNQAEHNQQVVYIEELLVMFCYAGIAIEPLLAYMASSTNFYVTIAIAYLIGRGSDSENYITDAFADNCPQINDTFNQWLNEHRMQLKQRADVAILNPKPISKTYEFTILSIELGLIELSNLKVPISVVKHLSR